MKKSLLLTVIVALAALAAKADWPFRAHRYDSFRATPVTEKSIVFFGNSITNMHEWREAFGDHPDVINRGNSGGYSYELLDNVESVIAGHPAKLFIGIGTNDLGTAGRDDPAVVASTIRSIVERFKAESPATKVYVQSILPTEVGLRSHAKTIPTNKLLKEMCAETGATYIDLWDTMAGIPNDGSISFDQLHVTAKGYTAWCRAIAAHVGAECTYPDPATTDYNSGGLGGSHGMRMTAFAAATVKPTDILIIGDEMIHGGEWHELLRNPNIKSRGTGWGYGGLNITQWENAMASIFGANASRKSAPAKIFIYTGGNETYGNVNHSVIINNYTSLINRIRQYAPATEINILSLVPRSNANDNSSLTIPVNDRLKALAASLDNVNFVDIYTPIAINGGADADPACITGNYVYGRGYNKIAQVLAPLVDGHAMTDAEFEAHYSTIEARNTLGNLIGRAGSAPSGTRAEAVAKARKLLTGNPSAAELAAAADEFAAAMKPEGGEGRVYNLIDQRLGRYCLEAENAVTSVTADGSKVAAAQWSLIPREDGTFDIVNRQTGNYVNTTAAHNTQLTTSPAAPSTGWQIKPSDTAGAYIIVNGSAQFNTTESGLGFKVFNWGSGNNTSDTGCQYYFAEEEAIDPVTPPAPGEDDSNPLFTLTDIDLSSGPFRLDDSMAAPVLAHDGAQTVAVEFTKDAADGKRHVIFSACNDTDSGSFFSLFNDNSGAGLIYTLTNDKEGWFSARLGGGTGRHRAVLVMDSPNYKLYVDGQQWSLSAAGHDDWGFRTLGKSSGAEAIYLGGNKRSDTSAQQNAGRTDLKGTIHSFRVYNRALTPAEVTALQWQGLTPTGIESVGADAAPSRSGIYDLQGRRLGAATAPGIYIIDGRKTLVR